MRSNTGRPTTLNQSPSTRLPFYLVSPRTLAPLSAANIGQKLRITEIRSKLDLCVDLETVSACPRKQGHSSHQGMLAPPKFFQLLEVGLAVPWLPKNLSVQMDDLIGPNHQRIWHFREYGLSLCICQGRSQCHRTIIGRKRLLIYVWRHRKSFYSRLLEDAETPGAG